jgi:secondary thiamine-phosphate synthase enzyme
MGTSNISVRPLATATRSVIVSDFILDIASAEPLEFIDLTDCINQRLDCINIRDGAATVYSLHTTAAIKINEAEELLIEDFKHFLRRLCPRTDKYNHNDMSRRKPPIATDERPNAHAHLMHLLLSTSETVPISDSRLALGTWQRVFMIELDGPRSREVMVRCYSHESRYVSIPNASKANVLGKRDRHVARGGLEEKLSVENRTAITGERKHSRRSGS